MVWNHDMAVQLATSVVGVYGLTLPISQRHPVHLMFAAINIFCSADLDGMHMGKLQGGYDMMVAGKLGVALVNMIAFVLSRKGIRGDHSENLFSA